MFNVYQEYSTHLDDIFSDSFDFLYLYDNSGNFIDVNDVMIKSIGYTKEEIKNMNISDFFAETEIGTKNTPTASKVKSKDGNIIYVEINTIPLKKNGKIYVILGIGHDVTKFKKMEQKLEKYKSIVENTTDLIIVTRFDGEHLYISPQYSTLLGYSEAEAHRVDFNLIHPDDRQRVMNAYQTSIKEKTTTTSEMEQRWKHKDGHYIWVATTSKNYYNKDGEVIGWITSIREISERKKAEKKQKESEQKYEALFRGSPVPTLTWQKVGENFLLIDYNKALQEYSHDDIRNYLNIRASDFFNHRPYILKDLYQCFNERISIQKEIRYFVNIFKEERDFSAKFAYIPPDLVLLHLDDITERKEADRKIRESEEKFRNIAEQSLMGILIIQGGTIKYMNNALSKISGYSIAETMNWSKKEMLNFVHPDDLEKMIKRLQSNINGTMGPSSNNFFRIFDKEGRIKWLQDYTSRVIYEGKVANLVSIVDITEKKQAEELIKEENKRLLELHELRKDLITRVSHELKTPMSSVYGASQILTKLYSEKTSDEVKKYIEIGYRGCLRLKQLIDNLLDVSRLDAKKFNINLQRENISELIIESLEDLNYLASNRNLKIKLEIPNEVKVNIDKLRFRQVLSNIISNAIKNTPKEGEISVELVELSKYIDINIKDTGVGLTENEISKLFEKFGKIERYGMDLGVDIEGSGLGLYISKEIVELHGGKIYVNSEGRNKGSTFTVRLFK